MPSTTTRTMRAAICTSILALLLAPLPILADSGTVWATPHDSYSSSIGVLGCKVDTNRIAYWPGAPSCSNLCVQLSYAGRSVKLLRVDSSEGAHDISYDAWNYLQTGKSAADKPTVGGAVPMEYKEVDVKECKGLIHTDGHKLPLSAANSMNFLASCLEEEGSWVAKNYVLYNVLDSQCSMGYDETCKLDWPNANQAKCPHTLGLPNVLKGAEVWNVQYGTGKKVLAGIAPGVASEGSGLRVLGVSTMLGLLAGMYMLQGWMYR